MYGKLFDQMYDSSLCECWQALITFQQMIVLADSQGVIDMTPEALHRRTNIPLDIIRAGIVELEKPDPRSRSPQADGRRLERLDQHRDWGWQIVNHQYYRDLASMEEKREADRQRIAGKRAHEKAGKQGPSQPVADGRGVSQQSGKVANVAYADTEADTDKKQEGASLPGWLNKPSWAEWVAYRKDIRKALTPRTIAKQLKQLEADKEYHIAIIEQSIQQGWTGLFPLKSKAHGNHPGTGNSAPDRVARANAKYKA